MSERVAMKKILDNIHNGEIMLLHPTSATNASIMKELIRELKAQGFRFATLEEI
jgi:peptidoglycan-N-acetylmuramic acid deacetylase